MINSVRLLALVVVIGGSLGGAHAADQQVERGKYLVNIIPAPIVTRPAHFSAIRT